eukprot:TRINITY_DN1801_c0_g2_i1.p1 TRINITY_DN1801_c0_g2~~TRINITY_DN1801_c0_g2_i1.p1  ORF type:complete len:548 (+),score=150.62 TRINITY_DN1801_c0_g2_i1:105-1748(+)
MLAALTSAALAAVTPPEQVRINLGKEADSMVVNWVTMASDGGSSVAEWGTTINLGTKAAGDSRNFTQDPGRIWYSHVATMTGLKENSTYYYRVGDSLNGWSATYSFVHRRQPSKGEPFRHILFGDMGSSCAFTLCDKCTKGSEVCDATTCAGRPAGLVSEVGTAGMWLHTGDFAYNLGSNNGTTGDQFFRNIEQIAASVPYMVSHGNHEDSEVDLAHYVESFRGQPVNSAPATFSTANGEAANSLYFSWDYGLVHYVAISTELWFGVESKSPAVNKTTMLDWIRKDLAAANRNRDATPWIVVHGHRSIYCSCDGDCDGAAEKVRADMEPIFMEYGVDFFINGHEHNYERSYPLYQNKSDKSNVDPKAPIYVVTGAAGSHELHEPFTRPQPAWSAFRSNSFCYTRMLVYNATHIHWQQVQTDPIYFPESKYGRVIDDAWIVQHNHGPFSISEAPQSVGRCEPGKCDTHDHWMPLLGIDAGERTSVDAIAQFRSTHGEAAWVAKLNGLMRWVETNLGGKAPGSSKAVWEDVRGDGSSDGAVFKWRNSHA